MTLWTRRIHRDAVPATALVGARLGALLIAALTALAALVAAPAALASSARGGAPASVVTRLGAVSRQRKLTIELPLKIDGAGLSRFADAVSTPGSPQYGDYEPVGTLAHRFGAGAAERSHVVDYLRTAGATDVAVDPTGLYVDATMRVGQAQRVFGTDLARYHSDAVAGVAAQTYIAPSAGAKVPGAISDDVTGVVGLNTRALYPNAEPAHADASQLARVRRLPNGGDTGDASSTLVTSGYAERTGTAAGCPAALAEPGFSPNEYLTAYGFTPLQELGLEGQGERVALIEIDGYNSSDVTAFDHCFDLPTPQINSYGVGIEHKLSSQGETDLDLELLSATAPKLKAIDVYESGNEPADVLRSLTAALAAKGRTPDVISASLGACEQTTEADITKAGVNAVEQALELAAASGVSVLASSGDYGSTDCVGNTGNPLPELSVNYPASSPWVTSVGGTNVKLSAENTIADPATDQVVWNDEPTLLGAGGGGVSMFNRPAYQKGSDPSGHREVPDVSMLADPLPGYLIYCSASVCTSGNHGSPWVPFGGTSAGTPLMAGGLALVDQELRGRGKANIGFANPILYDVARSSAGAATISDVITGTNDVSSALFGNDLGCCSAAVGYDEATGLGSVNIAALATDAEARVPKQTTVALAVPKQRRPVANDRFEVTVRCSRECLMGAYARIQIGSRTRTAYSKSYVLINRHSRRIKIGLSGPLRVRIEDALSKSRKVYVTFYGATVSPSGQIIKRTPGKRIRVLR